jgi:hypothetical protein
MKVLRFIYALYKYIIYGDTVDKLTYSNRISMCNSCEFLVGNSKCGICGCYVRKKAKWTTEHCPKNKW